MVELRGNEILFQGVSFKNPDVRKISDLADVLLEPLDSDEPAYFMYRGICLEKDCQKFADFKIRYDITVIPPRVIGKEYIKTLGHYHPKAENGLDYPEIYEVLDGEAIYLLQKRDLSDFVAVRAKKGDVVVIPPGYGHVTVNPSKKTLIMANLVSSKFKSEYEEVRAKKGFAYYLTVNGWVKNENYKIHPEIKEVLPKKTFSDIYSLFTDYPSFFDWLNRPSKLDWDLNSFFMVQV